MSSSLAPLTRRLLHDAAQRPRRWKYRALSSCPHVTGLPRVLQPVLFAGPGTIVLGSDVEFGWPTSAGYFTGYSHVEVSRPEASIVIGDGVQINNDAFLKSEGPGIRIGARTLVGTNVTILDSDFHALEPTTRRNGQPRMARVDIGEDVFVGERTMILKGVTIGAGAVVGAGSVVTTSIPAGAIAAGNPARVLRMPQHGNGRADVPGRTLAP